MLFIVVYCCSSCLTKSQLFGEVAAKLSALLQSVLIGNPLGADTVVHGLDAGCLQVFGDELGGQPKLPNAAPFFFFSFMPFIISRIPAMA